MPPQSGHPRHIIFLTCDANGVLPPVSKLTSEQCMYHFITGYTAKVAGTEMGVTEPESTFSACFGEAFLPKHPFLYAEMLSGLVAKHESHVWLINTGWSGGKYGVGKRMKLSITRALIDAIHSGELEKADYEMIPGFNLSVPKSVKGVDSNILNPINTWADKDSFNKTSKSLANQFIANMKKYHDKTPTDVIKKGGPSMSGFK